MSKAVVECREVGQAFGEVAVLRGVDLRVEAGERVGLVGASGSGKSSLLHILGGLAVPSEGRVWVDGVDINGLGDKAAGGLRNRALGFVYQFHHLLMEFSAMENVAMPLLIGGVGRGEAMRRAAGVLEEVGLGHRLGHKPGELSGGERQRTAIARAMVGKPKCILADEPTGNLDSKTARGVAGLLVELGVALVVATHDGGLARRMGRVVRIEDGVVG